MRFSINHPIGRCKRRSRYRVEGRRAPDDERWHAPYQAHRHAGMARSSFSIRIAVALNSAVPDFGSVASIVSRFVST